MSQPTEKQLLEVKRILEDCNHSEWLDKITNAVLPSGTELAGGLSCLQVIEIDNIFGVCRYKIKFPYTKKRSSSIFDKWIFCFTVIADIKSLDNIRGKDNDPTN